MLYNLVTLSSLIAYNLAANCCIDAPDETTCGDVATSPCTWIADNAAAMQTSQGIPCVSESWFQCEVNGVCPPPPPVPPVPKACIFDACANNVDVLNIAFLIDESGSVGRTNYITSLNFVEKMVKNDVNDLSKISMVSFATGLDRIYAFADSQTDQRAGALQAIQDEKNNYVGGWTATATGLREVEREFRESTAIDLADENVLILMTDGYPNQGGDPCDVKPSLDALGITTYIVGISSGFSKTAVQCLVDGDDDRILTIPQFTDKFFYHIEAQLRRVVCPPDVFKKDNFINNLFVSDATIINGLQENSMLYIIGLGLLICGGLTYYFREKICQKKGKYVALNNSQQSQYQSV